MYDLIKIDLLNTTICGTRPAYAPDMTRVVGGVDAREGEFPWMAYLYQNGYGQFCGATLIGEEWVVTAATACKSIAEPFH